MLVLTAGLTLWNMGVTYLTGLIVYHAAPAAPDPAAANRPI